MVCVTLLAGERPIPDVPDVKKTKKQNKRSLLAKVPVSLQTTKQPEGTLLRGLGVEMNTLHDMT